MKNDRWVYYRDVKPEDWFYPVVCWAYQTHCIPEGDTLNPNAPLSKLDFLSWLYTCSVGSGKIDPVPDWDEDLAQFRSLLANRETEVSYNDMKALAWAQKIGLFRTWGVTLGELLTRTKVTRLEAFGLLAVYVERSGK